MDSLTLRAVVEELNRLDRPRLQSVRAAGEHELRFRFDRDRVLVLSAETRHNTLYLTEVATDPEQETPFSRNLDRALTKAWFQAAVQKGLDRVIALQLQGRDRLGEPWSRTVVAELIGKGANVFLVEGAGPWSGKILHRLRSADRRPAYEPPPDDKPDAAATVDELAAAAAAAFAEEGRRPQSLIRAWSGVSPVIAREIWTRAEADENPEPSLLAEAWIRLVRDTHPGGGNASPGSAFAPTAAVFRADKLEAVCFEPRQKAKTVKPCSTVSEAAAAAHQDARRHAASGRHAPRLKAIRQTRKRIQNALEAQGREEDGPDARTLREVGEALLASAHRIQTGTAEATIEDPRTGEPTTVRLNPKLSPGENADLYFKRARKAERRGKLQEGRTADLNRRLTVLDALTRELEGGDPGPEWFRKARELGVKLPPEDLERDPDRRPEDRLPSALRPRRYTLGGGWELLVGKSNRGNEVLTHEIARPQDTWLHADQAAGSHAVLRHPERGKEVPHDVLLAAAAIAAWFSKARHAGKVPVLVTQKRFVRRIRKAPVGTVSVGQHKTLMVGPTNPDTKES